MNEIDKIVHGLRRAISSIAERHDSTRRDLIDFVGVDDEKDYNSVIDSLYLIEDTQLAKKEFKMINLSSQSLGLLYLFYYGVLNSCYMQQQAILVICSKLNILENVEKLKASEIIAYRNDFSAHSANRGRRDCEHSFILDRFAMREGKVKGYTTNHVDGTVFREADIRRLIYEWDNILKLQLAIISRKILVKVQVGNNAKG